MTDLLTPNEHLGGTQEQRRAIKAQLGIMRATPTLHHSFPAVLFVPMPDLIANRPAFLDLDLLHVGTVIAERRYQEVGLARLLPPERVWVGTASACPFAFGGFHYPGQGYRHLQMAAIITRYGNLAEQGQPDPRIVTLDLLRAYAHDSLHYGSYRLYQQRRANRGHEITRTRYGINFRRADGRTYSAPDPPDSPSTRNLGIIMEGATDREARAICRLTADLAHVNALSADPDSQAYRDTTGQFTPADIATHRLTIAPDTPARPDSRAYLARMASYQRTVGSKYDTFLSEVSPDAPADLHAQILAAMITGSLAHLSRTLNERYGPAAFKQMFKIKTFNNPRLAA
jgi:hypothetical protein